MKKSDILNWDKPSFIKIKWEMGLYYRFAMKHHGLLAPLAEKLEDKCRDNRHIPFDILLVNDGLFSENVMRKLIAKYSSGEWVSFYNRYVQDILKETLEVQPCVHILDCTKIPVNLDHEHYEGPLL